MSLLSTLGVGAKHVHGHFSESKFGGDFDGFCAENVLRRSPCFSFPGEQKRSSGSWDVHISLGMCHFAKAASLWVAPLRLTMRQ